MDNMLNWFANLKRKRQQTAEREGSPLAFYSPIAIVAGEIYTKEIYTQSPYKSAKYMPLNWIELVNNDVVDLTLIINGLEEISTPAGTIRAVRRPAIWQYGIRNDDTVTSTTSGKVTISFMKEARTADDAAREAV